MDIVVSRRLRLSAKLFIFAVLFEAIAVIAGLALAGGAFYEAVSSFPELTPPVLINASLGAIPIVLVAVTEAAKIPLTYSFFNVAGTVWRSVIAIALLAIAAITFFTAANGFERAYTIRAAAVETLDHKVAAIDRDIAEVNARGSHLQARRSVVAEQLRQIDAQEMREIEQHTERCKAVGMACNSRPYIEEIRRAAEAKRAPLRQQLSELDSEMSRVSTRSLLEARAEVWAALLAVKNENQLYRFAARVYGKSVEGVTVAEATLVAKFWFGSIGIIIALTGIVLAGAAALLASPPPGSGRLSRMLRLTLLRMRKRARVEVVRRIEVPGPERIVEKLVEKPIEHIRKIIVYVPHGYKVDEIDKANVEAVIEAQFGRGGQKDLRLIGGKA